MPRKIIFAIHALRFGYVWKSRDHRASEVPIAFRDVGLQRLADTFVRGIDRFTIWSPIAKYHALRHGQTRSGAA